MDRQHLLHLPQRVQQIVSGWTLLWGRDEEGLEKAFLHLIFVFFGTFIIS